MKIDRLVYCLILVLKFISNNLSIKSRNSFGIFLGRLMMLASKRKKITLSNIKNAFPNKSINYHYNILKNSYYNLGITFAELLHLGKLNEKEAQKYCNFENLEIIESYKYKGNGLILLSAHYGNWEYMAYCAGLFSNETLNIIVKPQKNKLADKLLNSFRTKFNNRVINMHSAGREMIDIIKDKGILALLVDQSASKSKDVFLNFFGRETPVFEAPAKLSLKYDVPILFGLSRRLADGTYSIKIEEISREGLENNREGVVELTRRHLKYLEDKIIEEPELWAWQHNRWKHSK